MSVFCPSISLSVWCGVFVRLLCSTHALPLKTQRLVLSYDMHRTLSSQTSSTTLSLNSSSTAWKAWRRTKVAQKARWTTSPLPPLRSEKVLKSNWHSAAHKGRVRGAQVWCIWRTLCILFCFLVSRGPRSCKCSMPQDKLFSCFVNRQPI